MNKKIKKVIGRYWGTWIMIFFIGLYFIINKYELDLPFLIMVVTLIFIEQSSHNVVMEGYGDKLE